jgi:hypothetical protein
MDYCLQSYPFLTNREMDQSTPLAAADEFNVVGQALRLPNLLIF